MGNEERKQPERPEATQAGTTDEAVETASRSDRPGEDNQELARTPGDGSLTGAVPAGSTVKELLERAESDDPAMPGTG